MFGSRQNIFAAKRCGRSDCLLLLSAIVAISIALLGGCSEAPVEPLRIGLNPWPGYEFLHVAERLGFFEEEGVDVELIQFFSTGDTKSAFDLGRIDGMGCTLIEVLQSREDSGRFAQVVYVTDFSDGADVVLGQESFETMEQLRGKRVAIEPGTLTFFMLAAALENAGMTLDDVVVVEMPIIAMPHEFADGNIDAAVAYPPSSLTILEDNSANLIFSSAQIPGQVVDVLAFDRRVLLERSADVAAVIRAFERAVVMASLRPSQVHGIIATRLQIPTKDIEFMLTEEIQIVRLDDQLRLLGKGREVQMALDLVHRALLASEQIQDRQLARELIALTPLHQARSKWSSVTPSIGR